MRIYYLAGVILSVATIISACGEGTPVECSISTAREVRQGVAKTAKFAAGTDCEQIRTLVAEGKPLPTIGDGTTTNAPPAPAQAPVTAPTFDTPLVSGQSTRELIETTDKEARVRELEQKIGVDSKQLRDPFTSTVINPVPKLETLLEKPKAPPKLRAAVVVRTNANRNSIIAPPDIQAAEGTIVTGTLEAGGTIYAIVKAFGETTSRSVSAGQLISNGKVLVKRIDTNAEPPIVVLQQNGVEVQRPVGAPVAGSTPSQPNQSLPANSATQSSEPPISIPPLIPAQ
ncbi:MAG: hypothetical protein AUK48_09885 [Oscillatoriales cyanobacterium CG2_30_44_21]|nr:MAG: hypothetical protein AUK48_09885 [Oscillatoriales cyanobacterium CG2_30_44_21]